MQHPMDECWDRQVRFAERKRDDAHPLLKGSVVRLAELLYAIVRQYGLFVR